MTGLLEIKEVRETHYLRKFGGENSKMRVSARGCCVLVKMQEAKLVFLEVTWLLLV